MKNVIAYILLVMLPFGVYAQSTIKKADGIYRAFPKDKFKATDSIVSMLQHDTWFNSLSPKDKAFRINRIHAYEAICKKKPSNTVYLKGWVFRALK